MLGIALQVVPYPISCNSCGQNLGLAMGPGDVGDVRWMGQRNPKHQLKTVGNLSHDFVGVSTMLFVAQDFATIHSIYHKPISSPSEQYQTYDPGDPIFLA